MPLQLHRLAKKIFGDVKEVPKIVQQGRKELYKGEGTHSLALWPFMAALRKLRGKNEINEILYQKYLRRLKNADEKLGKVLAQHGPSQRLFRVKERIPTTKKIKGMPASVEHETYSALAPVTKASKVVTPIAGATYVSEKMHGSPHAKEGADMASEKAKSLMKQAADSIERHRRREEAVKLAFAMVERGKCEPFESYDAFEEKVASLEEKNLEAVREALEMDSDLTNFGKVAEEKVSIPGASQADLNFFHRLSE